MTNVLVLCHGNINRSPLCSAILASHGINVRQAALKSTRPGWRPERASRKMRDAALELGFNLEAHTSSAITVEDVDWAHHIVVMDGGNERRLQELLQSWGRSRKMDRAKRLGRYASAPVERIPDPAFIKRGTQEFHDVVLLIEDASHNLAKKLIAQPG